MKKYFIAIFFAIVCLCSAAALSACKKTVEVSGITCMPNYALEVGESCTIEYVLAPNDCSNQSVTFTSSDEGVITVSEEGYVTAVAVGTAYVTVTTYNGYSDDSTFIVSEKSYTATFVADGETVSACTYTAGNLKITAPEVPEKEGYTGEWEEYTLTTEDIEINAVYTPIEYVAEFVGEDGVTLYSVNYTIEGLTEEEPQVPEKEYYTGAWESYALETGGITVKAVYTPEEYTAAFVANEETIYTETYNIERWSVSAPEVPYVYGYVGEWESYTLAAGGVTVKAVYTLKTCVATFIANGALVEQISFTIESEGITEPSVPNRNGYTGAWETYSLGDVDLTVNAVYSAVTYTITYADTKGAENGNSTSYTVESAFALVDISADGYTFDGWYCSGEKITSVKDKYSDLTLTAKWTLKEYFVYFYDEYGNTLLDTQTYTVEDPTITEPSVPEKEGYTGTWSEYFKNYTNAYVYAVYTLITEVEGETSGSETSSGSGESGGSETSDDSGSGETSGSEISGDSGSSESGGGESSGDSGSGETSGSETSGDSGSGETSGSETSGDSGSGETSGSETSGDSGSGETSGSETSGDSGSGESSGSETSGDGGSGESEGGETSGDTEGSEDEPENSYTITYKANGVVVATVKYVNGVAVTAVPAVPEEDGLDGEWEDCDCTEECTINALYTSKNATEGLVYETNEDGTLTVTSVDSGVTSVNVPAIYKNCTVTAISSSAFANNTTITELILPTTISQFECGVFAGMSKLVAITVPYVGSYMDAKNELSCFGYIFGTTTYSGGAAINQYYSSSYYNTYYIPKKLTSVTVLDGDLAYGAFCNCQYLTDVIICGGDSIGDSVFRGCSKLKNLTLPFVGTKASLKNASAYTLFGYIFGTESYSGGTEVTQYYASGKTANFYIPDSLTTVTILGGKIMYGAFYGCKNITTIYIGEEVESIGIRAFYECSALTSVYFVSESSWEVNDQTISISAGDNAINNINSYSGCEWTKKETEQDTEQE